MSFLLNKQLALYRHFASYFGRNTYIHIYYRLETLAGDLGWRPWLYTMTKEQAIDYAVKELPNILPLDSDQIKDLCEQTIKENDGNSERIAQALFEILGQDDLSVHFIFEFNERLMEPPKKSAEIEKPAKPVNQVKLAKPEPSTRSRSQPVKETETAISSPPVKETSTGNQPVQKGGPKRAPKDSKEIRLESLKDIDDVLKMLELRSGSGNPEQYKCDCQGTRHPLFDPAPNCLHCGKIICVKEGLHMNDCSFCHEELIPREERDNIMKLLQMEKEHIELKKVQENMPKPKPKQTKKYKITSGAGTNLWKEQEKMLQRVEKDRNQERETKRQQILNQNEEAGGEDEEEQLKEARMRLEKLLHYQDTSAERTKIIDNASDFALNEDVMWGSAYERALQLKKQQRNLRKWEKIEKERNGRREKIVLDLTIGKDGKVVMTEAVKKNKGNENINAASDDEFDDISDEEDIQDLEDIHNLKAEINSQREQERSKLLNRVWDYEKAQAEFSKPVYVPGPDEQTDKVPGQADVQKKVHRVQVGDNDRPSLQDNILAIL